MVSGASDSLHNFTVFDAAYKGSELGLAVRSRLGKNRFQLTSYGRYRDAARLGNRFQILAIHDRNCYSRFSLRKSECGPENPFDVGRAADHILAPLFQDRVWGDWNRTRPDLEPAIPIWGMAA